MISTIEFTDPTHVFVADLATRTCWDPQIRAVNVLEYGDKVSIGTVGDLTPIGPALPLPGPHAPHGVEQVVTV